MNEYGKSSLVTVGVVLVLLLSLFIVLPRGVAAAVVTHDSDTDFAGGLMNGVEIIGTGNPAVIEIIKDLSDWIQMSPPTAPSQRSEMGYAFDEVNGEMVVFGGVQGSSNYQSDTWRYNLSSDTWTEVTPVPSPGPRYYHGMAYDSSQQVIVMYGGLNTSGLLTDTWEFDVNTDTWAQTAPPTNPGGYASVRLAYDSVAGRVILAGTGATSGVFETWAYDAAGDTWTQRNPASSPSIRDEHALAYFPDRDRTVLFGGSQGLSTFDDTWEYSYSADSWSQIGVTGPSSRRLSALAYRSASSDLILYGGADEFGTYHSDTWTYDSSGSWSALTPPTTPGGRASSALTYDSANDATLLFGGKNALTQFNDTWMMSVGYRAGGIYRSNRIDSGSGATIWREIWFNNTPANQPAATTLRFQLFTTNVSNPPSFSFIGPDCTSGTYYNATPQNICSQQWGRYAWYLAQLLTSNPAVTPTFDNVSIVYTVPDVPPQISSAYPVGPVGAPLTAPVYVNFSEAMNTSSVTLETSPGGIVFTHTWSNGDSSLVATHPTTPFSECKAYWVWVNGTDLSGNQLVPGPVTSPWVFTTACQPPEITMTDPSNASTDVPLTKLINVTFSEPMDTTSAIVNITPPLTLTQSWSAGDTLLTLSHATDFATCTWYTVEVVQAKDKAGANLFPGLTPNPWIFQSVCPEPFVVVTDPGNSQLNVPLSTPIVITFSEPMDTASVSVGSSGAIPGRTDTWSGGDSILTITHTGLTFCENYTLTVDGRDVGGTPMKQPYSWWFITDCTGPVLISLYPPDGAMNVPLDQTIYLNFTEPMDTASVSYTITGFPTTQDLWFNMDTSLWIIMMSPLPGCTNVTFDLIIAKDTLGRDFQDPNNLEPMTFSTVCPNPFIVSTNPFDTETGVELNRSIVVVFDHAMDPANTQWNITPFVTLNGTWSGGDTILTLTHTTDFAICTTYTVTITGQDMGGYALQPGLVPNPWSFTTICGLPWIVSTDPFDGETAVEVTRRIVVTFSEAMDVTSFTISCTPPISVTGTTWSGGDTIVTLDHVDFTAPTTYTCTVAANDTAGNPLTGTLGAPNPWSFTTASVPPPTAPPRGLWVERSNPDIIVHWNAVAGATDYSVYRSNSRLSPLSLWTKVSGVTGLSWTHANAYTDGLQWFYIVRGANAGGEGPNSTMGAKIDKGFGTPGPGQRNVYWMSLPYNSAYAVASDIASELTSGKVNIIGKWDPATQSSLVYYFRGGRWRGTDFAISAGDGIFVNVVTPFNWVIVGTDSSVALSFTFGAVGSTYRISLPYTNSYASASDVVAAIEANPSAPVRISALGMWDPTTRTDILYWWNGATWMGTDFGIVPGDGFRIDVIANFVWTPGLVTPEQP